MTAPVAPRPNVIVFFTDQQRWDTTGAHGNPLGITPNFDRICQRGTFFEYAFTPNPVCAPARAALQTGRYPTEVGVHCNGLTLPTGVPSMARWFGDAGFDTAYFGKWHLASQDPVPEGERGGYTSWLAANRLEWTSRPYDTRLYNEADEELFLPGYRTDALVDATIQWIDGHVRTSPEKPFFVFLSLLEPHHQNNVDRYVAPDGYERYGTGWVPADLQALAGSSATHLPGYLGCIKRIDEGLGRLLDALHSLSLTDDTVLFYTSDHGCHFRTRNDEYKRSCHEASIRLPMAAQGPYFDNRGVVSDLVSLLDVPTMLGAAAGLKLPSDLPGRHLADGETQNSVTGGMKSDVLPEGLLVQISESEVGRALRTRRWKYHVQGVGVDSRDPAAKTYIERSLFDLEDDPHELRNLAFHPGLATVRAELREHLRTRMALAGEPDATITTG